MKVLIRWLRISSLAVSSAPDPMLSEAVIPGFQPVDQSFGKAG